MEIKDNENGGNKKVNNTAFDFSELDNMFAAMSNSANNAPAKVVEAEETTNNVVIKNTGANIAPDKNLLDSAVKKMHNIEIEMNDLFIEREELIKIMELAVVTRSNLLMLGKPGTAKSQLTYEICSRIKGANYFQWMLNKTSDPSEILGPFSVKQMENDHFMRITTGKLPEAHIAFMDEIYKSNAPTLNALLTIMNEHIFYNDGKPVDVPLITMFGASNEPPEDDSLLALHDRFIFRIDLEYIHDAIGRKKMHSNYIQQRNGSMSVSKTYIDMAELEALHKACMLVDVPRDIINAFIRFIDVLGKNYAIRVSDRRLNECLKVMQGSAVLNGRNVVCLDDFNSLLYVLWEDKEQIKDIDSELKKVSNPYDEQFDKLKDSFLQIKNKIENASSTSEKMSELIKNKTAISRIVGRLNKLITEATKNRRDTTKFEEFRDEIIDYNSSSSDAAFNSKYGTTDISDSSSSDDSTENF